MSNSNSHNLDQDQHSDIPDDNNFENDDLISFQHDSKTIKLFYSQLTKYSKHIRESYLFSDVMKRFPQEIYQFQEKFHLLPESLELFFQLLQQNYDINEDLNLTYIQCMDLLKISKYLEVRKLSFIIKQYIKGRNNDVDFIIQMIQYDSETQQETDKQQIEISDEVENLLTSKINECFSNEKFKELPIHIIHRVVRRCSADSIDNNKLFDIIVQSLSKFCILFPFLDLQKLSDDRLEELCAMYSKSNENTQHYFDFLKCNLNLINEINNRKKKLEEMNDQQQNKMSDLESKIETLQNQFINTEKVNNQLQNQLNDSKNLNDQQQNKMTDMESKIALLQSQLDDSQSLNNQQQNKMADLESKIALLQKQFDEKINEQLQHQVNYSKKLEDQISQLQNKLTNSEKEVTGMKKQLNELLIKGKIVANVEKGLLINAEIDLKTKGPALDTSKSKVIISTSDAKCLGSEAYEKGEPITSLHMKTTFMCKPGTYYVRCIIFNNGGESNEIVSNPATTSGSSLEFDYKREAEKITLPCGRYKLEVWGAKGGTQLVTVFIMVIVVIEAVRQLKEVWAVIHAAS